MPASATSAMGRARAAAASTSWAGRVALLAVTTLALAVRLHDLTGPSLSSDEVFSLLAIRRDFGAMVWATALDAQHTPLYYSLLWGWLALLGDGEHAARLLSVLFGVLTVPVVYCLGRRVYGPGAGLLAALLMSLSQFHWLLSQMVRMYSLVVFLAALSMLAAVRLWESGEARRHRLYAGVTGLLVYGHLYGWLLVVSQNAAAILHTRPLAALVRWARTQMVVVLMFLPWVAAVISALAAWGWRRTGRDLWYLPAPSIVRPLEIVSELNGELSFLYSRRLGLALWGIAFCLAAGDLGRRLLRDRRWEPGRLGLFLAIVLPLGITGWLALVSPVFGMSRYLSIVLPAYYVFVAGGAVAVLPRRSLAGTLTVCLTVWSLGAMAEAARRYAIDPYREVAAYIRGEGAGNVPVVLIGPSGVLPLRYYGLSENRSIKHVAPAADGPPTLVADCLWVIHRHATASTSPLLVRLGASHAALAARDFPLRNGIEEQGLRVALLERRGGHTPAAPPGTDRVAAGRCR